MARMQNNKTYIAAGLVLFEPDRGVHANQSKTAHFIQYETCFASVILSAGKPTMQRCWHRQLRFSKKRMLPASSVSLIAPL